MYFSCPETSVLHPLSVACALACRVPPLRRFLQRWSVWPAPVDSRRPRPSSRGRSPPEHEEVPLMEVKVLGPLEAEENGVSVVPTAGKLRQILALLALEAGQVVTVPTLIEELWRMEPPRSALTTLQTYILQLRRMIDAALGGNGSGVASRRSGSRRAGWACWNCASTPICGWAATTLCSVSWPS